MSLSSFSPVFSDLSVFFYLFAFPSSILNQIMFRIGRMNYASLGVTWFIFFSSWSYTWIPVLMSFTLKFSEFRLHCILSVPLQWASHLPGAVCPGSGPHSAGLCVDITSSPRAT